MNVHVYLCVYISLSFQWNLNRGDQNGPSNSLFRKKSLQYNTP